MTGELQLIQQVYCDTCYYAGGGGCSDCQGLSWVAALPGEETCPACEGDGTIEIEHVDRHDGTTEWVRETCLNCEGLGVVCAS